MGESNISVPLLTHTQDLASTEQDSQNLFPALDIPLVSAPRTIARVALLSLGPLPVRLAAAPRFAAPDGWLLPSNSLLLMAGCCCVIRCSWQVAAASLVAVSDGSVTKSRFLVRS